MHLGYSSGAHRPSCPAIKVEDLDGGKNLEFELKVKNVGNKDGSEVVIVYSKPPEGILASHIKQVIGFKRVFIQAGKSRKVNFEISACKGLEIVDFGANRLLPSGVHTIIIGDDVVSFLVQEHNHNVSSFFDLLYFANGKRVGKKTRRKAKRVRS